MVFIEVIKNTSLKTRKNKTSNSYIILLIGIAFFACACNSSNTTREVEKGTVIPIDTLFLGADSSQAEMLNTLIFVYEGLSPYKKVIPIYAKEKSLYAYLQNNKVDLILRSYPLTEMERKEISNRKLNAKEFSVWHDALAVIANKNFEQNSITEQDLQIALLGKHTSLKVLIDKANTSAYDIICSNYFSDPSLINAYAAGTEENIIAQVAKNTNYIGLLSSGRFSGYKRSDDSLLKQVMLLGVVPKNKQNPEYPFQDQLYNKVYPLARTIHSIDVGALDGLASSFVAYILSERGQRVILKSGLLPAIIPPRTIEIN